MQWNTSIQLSRELFHHMLLTWVLTMTRLKQHYFFLTRCSIALLMLLLCKSVTVHCRMQLTGATGRSALGRREVAGPDQAAQCSWVGCVHGPAQKLGIIRGVSGWAPANFCPLPLSTDVQVYEVTSLEEGICNLLPFADLWNFCNCNCSATPRAWMRWSSFCLKRCVDDSFLLHHWLLCSN